LLQHKEQDFRTRTAQLRRARTRKKILDAAFRLINERGVDGVSIDDVRASAELSRGSFYNYFATFQAMLEEMAGLIAAQINKEQSEHFDKLGDMAARLGQNFRYFVLRAASDKPCGDILIRVIPLVGPLNAHMRDHIHQEMNGAVKSGIFSVPSVDVSLEVGSGLVAVMIRRALARGIDRQELSAATFMLLRAMGVPSAKAKDISAMRLPRVPNTPLGDSIVEAQFGESQAANGSQPLPQLVPRAGRI
jgi:AcrR family transcriptional regulator